MPPKKGATTEVAVPDPEPEAPPPPPPPPEREGYLVTIFEDGSGSILYPSGRVAATIVKFDGGGQTVITHDNPRGTVLASFDYDGVGTAHFKSGAPRLVVSKQGWMQLGEDGARVEAGGWPRAPERALQFKLNKCFSFQFMNRQNITITYAADGELLELAVGETKKRADAENYLHTAVGVDGGKAILDVEARRHEGALLRHAHTAAELHKFSPMGPHLQPAEMAGVFRLRQTLPSVQVSEMQEIIDDQCLLQQRLRLLRTLPLPGAHAATNSRSGRPTLKYEHAASHKLFHSAPLAAATYAELPPLVHSKAQQRAMQQIYKIAQPAKSNYKSKRRKLLRLPMKEVDAAVDALDKGVLLVLACIADWNPLCRKVVPLLESINQHIQSIDDVPVNSKANHPAKHATWTPPKIPGKVKVMTVDMSESQLLQNRYNFRCCPMFLCFWDYKLVHASNTMRYTDEFYKQVISAIESGMKGEFLPKDFKFHGVTNHPHAILDRAM